jgi:hypothetical protein
MFQLPHREKWLDSSQLQRQSEQTGRDANRWLSDATKVQRSLVFRVIDLFEPTSAAVGHKQL